MKRRAPRAGTRPGAPASSTRPRASSATSTPPRATAFRAFLKPSDMLAYLMMMAVRLRELGRVLKPTGSIYLHCDPTAAHYLKLLMDAVFDTKNYRNQIIW